MMNYDMTLRQTHGHVKVTDHVAKAVIAETRGAQ